MRGTTAVLSPRLRASLSRLSSSFFSGNNAVMRVYPGKKSTNASPRVSRSGLFGRVSIVMSRVTESPMDG